MKRWWPILANVLAFDATWTIALFAAARGWAWLGAGVMLGNAAVYLALTSRNAAASWKRELLLLGGFAALGAAIDTLLCSRGIIGLAKTRGATPEFAVFFFALWANFGTTLRLGFSWAWNRPWVGALFGLIGGPLGYLIGERIGAVSIGAERARSLGILAAEFAVLIAAWFFIAGLVLPRRVT
jgi:hypothetical protein